MKYLVIALALLAMTPSQADETDLPVWYKEKALLKSYNLLVKKANHRRKVIIDLCACDPTAENIALAKATPSLAKADTFSDVPEKYQNYDDNTLSEDRKRLSREASSYFRLLLECDRAKGKSEG